MMTGFLLAFMSISPGPGEILLVFVVLLLLFGANNIPKVARNFGKAMEAFRRASKDVTDEIMRSDIEPEPDEDRSLPVEKTSSASKPPYDKNVEPRV